MDQIDALQLIAVASMFVGLAFPATSPSYYGILDLNVQFPEKMRLIAAMVVDWAFASVIVFMVVMAVLGVLRVITV